MIELESAKRINDLKQAIEATTGESYENLTEAVQGLKDGYSNEEFIGVKYLEFDEEGYPTIADARPLGKSTVSPAYTMVGVLYNVSRTNGFNVRVKEAYLPDNITHFNFSFQHCYSLEKLHGNFENLTYIGATSFGNCVSLKELPYMPNVETIASSAFVNCTGLEEVKIYKKVSTISSNAFNGCTNLKDIYVPWAEGVIGNAPWGATNATIHYNTTYDENHNPIV